MAQRLHRVPREKGSAAEDLADIEQHKEEKHQEAAGLVTALVSSSNWRLFRGELSVNRGNHRRHPGNYPLIEVRLAKVRGNHLADDAAGGQIGEAPLETIADLNSQPPVIVRDQEQGTVVEAALTKPPGLEYLQGVLFKYRPFKGFYGKHGDLGAFLSLEIGEKAIQVLHGNSTEYSGVIVYPAPQWRNFKCYGRQSRSYQAAAENEPDKPQLCPEDEGGRGHERLKFHLGHCPCLFVSAVVFLALEVENNLVG